MYFVAILIGLSVERWTGLSRQLRAYPLLEKYLELVKSFLKTPSLPNWFYLVIFLVPIAIVAKLLYLFFSIFFFGLIGLVFAVVVLFYCLGSFPTGEHGEGMENMVVQANHNIFSVLFWFMIFGPAGAVLYRVNNLLVSNNVAAEQFQMILEWIPVRLEVVGYAIVSHFKVVMTCLAKYLFNGLNDNEQLLIEAAAASIDANVDNVIQDVLKLIDRALLAWLVLIAIVVIL